MSLSQEQLDRLRSGLGSSDTVVPSMNQAFTRDPDQFAETLRLSKLNNVPTDVAERNLDDVKRTERIRSLDVEALRRDAPKTTDYLSDPDKASVSSDDVDNLSNFEKAFGKYQRPWWDMDLKDWEGMGTVLEESFMQSGRGTKAQILDAKRRRIEETIERERKAGIPVDEMTYPSNYLEETLDAAEKNVEKMKVGQKVIEEATPEDLPWISEAARAGAQSVVENLPGLAMTLLTRRPVYGLTNIGALTHGRAYGEATVEGLSPEDRAAFAALKTGVEVGTEIGPLNILADMVGTKTFLRKAGQFAISELGSEQIATGLETVVENVYDMDEAMAQAKTLDEKIDIQLQRQLLTFGATLFGGGGQIAIAGGANYIARAADRKINGDLQKIGKSMHEQAVIDAAITLSQSSKTRERSPEQFREFVKNVGGDTTLTIPAEATEGLEGLPEYMIPGQDNEVGLELFMQDIAPVEEWISQIRPHVKIDPRGYSQVEMEQDDRADIRKVMEKAVKNQETLNEAQQIWATVKDQLVATERQGEETARMSAQLYPAFATVMSEKLRSRGHDVSPAQVFEDMGFKVERAAPTVTEETLTQSDFKQPLDVVMDDMERLVITDPANPDIVFTVAENSEEPEYMSAYLEVLDDAEKLGGKGTATRLYMEGLKIAKDGGLGWKSDSIRSIPTDRMYKRLIEAGVPFVEEDMGYSISPAALDNVDLDQVSDRLREKYRTPEAPKDGRDFKNFFSSVVTGMAGKSDTGTPYEPVIQGREDLGEFAQEYADHRGNFDDHIAFSIPGFKEVQMAVGNAVVEVYGEDAVLLDIGASEGSFGKTITALGGPQTVSVDPNPDMAAAFAENPVEGATYEMAAFSQASEEGVTLWDEGGVPIVGFIPTQKYDVVHEAMVFQFIENDRPAQISRMKEMMKEDGVLVIEEKFHNDQWEENEARKDEVKRKYFQPKDMSEKAKAVLEGMNENMTTDVAMEELLTQQFKHVVQFWDSGNFKGYMASDDQDQLAAMIDATGNLTSEHSTVETPRIVEKKTVTLPVETIETGEVTEETFAVQEISGDISAKMDAYQQLLECLRS